MNQQTHDELLNNIKKEYRLVIVTLDDMTKVIYSNSDEIYSKNINDLHYLGLFGSAYRYNNEKVEKLNWLKSTIDKNYLVTKNEIETNKIILHHTLVKRSNTKDKLVILEVLQND